MLARERIGIVVVRKGEHAHVHVDRQQHVDAPERSLDAGGVPVVEHGDVLGEALDQADLPVGERSAGGGHHVLHPGLVHGYDVRIALHQVARILPHDGVFGLIEAVEDVALVVDGVLGRIEVLGNGLFGLHRPRAETGYAPRKRVDGKDHAPAETVGVTSVVPPDGQPGGFEVFGLITGLERRFGEGGPSFGGVSEAEFFDRSIGKSPLAEIRQSDIAPFGGLVQLLAKPLGGVFGNHVQALAFVGFLFGLGGELGFLDLDPLFFGDMADGFGIGAMLDLHDEGNHAAALARGEVFPDALGGRYDKRRGLFVVERRKAFVVGSGTFENDEIAHHFLDARFGKYPVYRLAGDHRAKEICGRIFPSIFSVTRYVGRTPASPKGPEARVREVSRGLSEA